MNQTPFAMLPTFRTLGLAVAVCVAAALGGCAPPAGSPSARTSSSASTPKESAEKASPLPADLRSERIAVRFSDVDRVQAVLTEIFDLNRDEHGAVRALLVDHETDEIVVVGTPAGIERVRTILGPALAGDDTDRDVAVLHLQHGHANDVARALQSIVDDDVILVPDSATNALVVRARGDDQAKVAALVKEMDIPRDAGK